MNHHRLAFLSALLLVASLLPLPAGRGQDSQGGPEGEAPWFDQLRAMGYALYLNSNANVLNGLNLTREQAVALHDLSVEVLDAKIERPVPNGRLSPEVQEVVDAYAAARKVLLAGEAPGPEVEARVAEAREKESEIIHAGLRWEPERDSCARCHATPEEGKPSSPWGFETVPDKVKKLQAVEHLSMGLDVRDFPTLLAFGRKVDEVLTDNQKSAVSGFSCCLLPPKDMADPVRVGQASAAPWQEDLLDKAREVPDGLWPAVRERALEKIIEAARVKNPGLTGAQARELSNQVGEVLDRARTLDDIDYELEKADLVAGMGLGPAAPSDQSATIRQFTHAFFLLLPGSEDAYHALLAQLDRPDAPTDRDVEIPYAEQPT